MAKVRGPLMSLDARGAIAKTLVFLGWKGLKTVRQHVVPANPRTLLQTAQRDLFKSAVGYFHTRPYTAVDKAALNLVASMQAAIMSGFNWFVKMTRQYMLDPGNCYAPYAGSLTDGEDGTVAVSFSLGQSSIGKLRWGYSPTVMGNILDLVHALPDDPHTCTIEGIIGTQTIYCQPYTEDEGLMWVAGIYKGISTGGVAV